MKLHNILQTAPRLMLRSEQCLKQCDLNFTFFFLILIKLVSSSLSHFFMGLVYSKYELASHVP